MIGPSPGGITVQGPQLSTGTGEQPQPTAPSYLLDWESPAVDVRAIRPDMFGEDLFKVLGGYAPPPEGTSYQDYLNELKYQTTTAITDWDAYRQTAASAPAPTSDPFGRYAGPRINPLTNRVVTPGFTGAAAQVRVERPYNTYAVFNGLTPAEVARKAAEEYRYMQEGGIGLPFGLDSMIGPLATVASFVPGLQPLALGLNALNTMEAASNDNFSGALMGAVGMMPGVIPGITNELAGHIPTDLPLDSMTIAKGIVGGGTGALGQISQGNPLEGLLYGAAPPLISGGLQRYGDMSPELANQTVRGGTQGLNYLLSKRKRADRNAIGTTNQTPAAPSTYYGTPSSIGLRGIRI